MEPKLLVVLGVGTEYAIGLIDCEAFVNNEITFRHDFLQDCNLRAAVRPNAAELLFSQLALNLGVLCQQLREFREGSFPQENDFSTTLQWVC